MLSTGLTHRIWRGNSSARLLVAFAVFLSLQVAWADLLFYEGFNYPAGEKLADPSSITTWENPKTQFTIAGGSLDYPGLETSAGNRLSVQSGSPSLDSVRTVTGAWKEQSRGTLYISFLLRVESGAEIGSTDEGASLLTINHTSNKSQLLGINLLNTGAVRLGVLKYPSDGTIVSASTFFTNGPGANLSANGSTTYFIVAKYEWKDGPSNDEVTLWVNPRTLGGSEDAGEEISIHTGMDGDKSAGRLTLSRGPNVSIDELRIGQTWAEVTPVARPPRQSILVVLILAGGLVVAGLWIAHLRRKVKERSAALGAQIQQRQKAEQQRLMEQERARIAHDLHDELGADITEISMLATRAQGNGEGGEETRRCLKQMADKSRQMVAKLEEIVWAMNPERDSLGALVSYFSFFADRFLGLANIKLIIDTSEDAASLAVDARVRHQLFLVFKEALANVVRHSGASEVRVIVRVEDRALRAMVADNGCGLHTPDATTGGHEGIANMRRRMEKIGGQFEITGEAGHGTTVKFSVTLDS
jgi:signal transduction histidine kinase